MKKKCKHCGKPIGQAPYGPPGEFRWVHLWKHDGKDYLGDVHCKTTKAAPRGKRAG